MACLHDFKLCLRSSFHCATATWPALHSTWCPRSPLFANVIAPLKKNHFNIFSCLEGFNKNEGSRDPKGRVSLLDMENDSARSSSPLLRMEGLIKVLFPPFQHFNAFFFQLRLSYSTVSITNLSWTTSSVKALPYPSSPHYSPYCPW